MAYDSVINVVVSEAAPPLSQTGSSTPLIAGTTAREGSELVRFYATMTEVGADYDEESPEYLMAAKVFSQKTRPRKLAIGKRATLPTQSFTFVPVAGNGKTYGFSVDGVEVEFTSDSSGTLAEAVAGLVAEFDAAATALGGDAPAVTVTNVGPGTSVKVLADAAGAWHDVKLLTPKTMSMLQDQADAGIQSDLAAFLEETRQWYGVLSPFNSKAEAMKIAEWVEANERFYFLATVDTAVLGTYVSATPDNDVGGALKSRTYKNSMGTYQRGTGDFADAALLGRFLGSLPGSLTMHLKAAVGVPGLVLTSTEVNNLKARSMNPYVLMDEDSPALIDGKVFSGQFADIIRDTRWHIEETQRRLFRRLYGAEKLPYTDGGISVLSAEVAGQAEVSERAGFLRDGWTVTTTPIEETTEQERAERRYPGVLLEANYAAAIHSVDPLRIRFSV